MQQRKTGEDKPQDKQTRDEDPENKRKSNPPHKGSAHDTTGHQGNHPTEKECTGKLTARGGRGTPRCASKRLPLDYWAVDYYHHHSNQFVDSPEINGPIPCFILHPSSGKANLANGEIRVELIGGRSGKSTRQNIKRRFRYKEHISSVFEHPRHNVLHGSKPD